MVDRPRRSNLVSVADTAEPKHEIIIVRRGGHDDHDGHHGGAWKIAFADFMTAMMCFFLVMWLINAANEQTQSAVASYFNPIKLTDKNASRRGLDDEGEGATSSETQAQSKADPTAPIASKTAEDAGTMKQQQASKSDDVDKQTDEHLFSNPYAVLAEIAAETGMMQNMSAKGEGGAQDSGPATGASGGESFRDPFAPDFWSQQIVPGVDSPPVEQEVLSEPSDSESTEAAAKREAAAEPKPEAASRNELAAAPEAQSEPAPEPKLDPAKATEAAKVEAAEIRQEIQKALGKGDKVAEGITVEATANGIIISVTDQLDFGMFEIGSALPRRDLVLAMEKIGKILSERRGSIHVNGHTDGRPFAGEKYDNWRLSTARAHSAYYMLVRSGLDEKRMTEVAGFADRKLKILNDPLAAANRRIEIFLETGG
jgi:chemotaxis protein MotB